MKFGTRKLESWGYDTSFIRFDTIPARDRRTDRRVAVAKTHASIASRV